LLLAPQAQAVAAPVEDLQTVGTTIAKNEQVAAKRIGLQAILHQREQAVEAQTHIDGVGAIPQFDGSRDG
jgi:hypothetical protein